MYLLTSWTPTYAWFLFSEVEAHPSDPKAMVGVDSVAWKL